MRQKRTAQLSFFEPDPVDQPVADALEAISAWLDDHPELLEAVAADLGAESGSCCGRHGLSCETVLRCAVLKHLRQETWRGLEFTLRDSRSARRFARVEAIRVPKSQRCKPRSVRSALTPGSASTAACCARHRAREWRQASACASTAP